MMLLRRYAAAAAAAATSKLFIAKSCVLQCIQKIALFSGAIVA